MIYLIMGNEEGSASRAHESIPSKDESSSKKSKDFHNLKGLIIELTLFLILK